MKIIVFDWFVASSNSEVYGIDLNVPSASTLVRKCPGVFKWGKLKIKSQILVSLYSYNTWFFIEYFCVVSKKKPRFMIGD